MDCQHAWSRSSLANNEGELELPKQSMVRMASTGKVTDSRIGDVEGEEGKESRQYDSVRES